MFFDKFLFNMCGNIVSLTDGNIRVYTDLNINNDITAMCPSIHLINSQHTINRMNCFLKSFNFFARSEERRVGKECRYRLRRDHYKKKTNKGRERGAMRKMKEE